MLRATVRLLVALALGSALPAAAQQTIPDGLIGRWAGASIQAGTPLLFELSFARGADGALQTELTLPYNGYDRFPFVFTYEPSGAYDGTLTAGLFGDAMRLVVDLPEGHLRGTVTVGDSVVARVHLQKVLDHPLPSIQSETVRFPAGRDTLTGTLLMPEGAGRPAVAVLVAGRGQGSRVGMIGWAKLLARAGVGALTFDVRGTGESTGRLATGADREADVRAALDYLAARGDVGRMGLVSYSAGGWIVPDVAASRGDVAFVVTLVGPAQSLADQQALVTTAFMRASGDAFTDDEYAAAYAYQEQTVGLAQSDAPWSAFERINAPARAARWAEHALIPDSLDAPDLAYFRLRTTFDAPDWDDVRVPVLTIFGENDLIVPPEANVPLLREAFADHPDATILVLPGADHTLARPPATVGEGDWPNRFYRPWTRSPLLFDTLTAWLAERFVSP